MPNSLVLLASEQLWPNIHSVEHLGPQLDHVYIYHTGHPEKSVGPARRLANFCNERFQLKTTRAEGTATPEAVARQIGAGIEGTPGHSWIINATGGTKPMYDGAASFRGRPDVRVVYREFGRTGWFALGRTDAGLPTATPFPLPIEVTDEIPVALLLRTLWETDTLRLEFGDAPTKLPLLKVAHAVAVDGKWREAFATAGVPLASKTSGGDPFERYVAAALLEMDVTNVAHSVKQVGPSSGKKGEKTQEIDLIANYKGRLLVFDCKLTSEGVDESESGNITTQLRHAAQTARQIGGIGGEVVLLRPNREVSGAFLELARDLRVRVIDKRDRGCFFRRLAEFVECPVLPEVLRQVDEVLAHPPSALCAFEPASWAGSMARGAGGSPVVDLSIPAGDWARECCQDWTVVRIRGELHYLQLRSPEVVSRVRLREAVNTALGPFASRVEIGLSGSGNTLYAVFTVPAANDADFRAFLASRTGAPLLSQP